MQWLYPEWSLSELLWESALISLSKKKPKSHLINDMKLESSQFIYYPKQAELLFACVDVLITKLYNRSSG
jgi:hypothetical protein